MAKRTFAIVAVFAALLSVTLSVQAQDTYDNSTLYWIGGAGDNKFYTGTLNKPDYDAGTISTWTSNWKDADGTLCPTRYISGAGTTPLWTQNCFVYSATNRIWIDYGSLGVASLTIGDGNGSSQTATMYRDATLYLWKPLTVQAGGTLEVSGLDITNGGELNLNGGTIKIGSGGFTNAGNPPNYPVTSYDYTINLGGGTLGNYNNNWSSALNANVLANTETTFDTAEGKTITWSGVLSGSGSIVKSGAGTLTLSGANTYSGGTTISNGTLKLTDSGSLGSGSVVNNATLEFAHTSPQTFSGVISGTGTIKKTGSGTLTLNAGGNNTIGCDLIIDNGIVSLGNTIDGANRFKSGVTVTVNSGGKFQLDAHDCTGYSGVAATFNLYGGTFAININGNETLANKTINLKGGSITTLNSNGSMLDIFGTGNAFNVKAETGATSQNPTTSYVKGWLRLRNTSDFNITVDQNAKLIIGNEYGGITQNGTPSPLVKLGKGCLVFAGTNTYSATTKVMDGELVLPSGGTFTSNGDMTILYDGKFIVDGGTFSYNNANRLHNAGTITLNSGSFTVSSSTASFVIGEWFDGYATHPDGVLNINGGTLTVGSPLFIGTAVDGIVNQTNGSATFSGDFYLGWGNNSGTYNLSGGTLTTTGSAGLWNQNSTGISTFNVTGGEANFNTFDIGIHYAGYADNELANVFNLYSGEVNTTGTFTVRKTGILNVAQNGETGGDGEFKANAIEINTKGKLNLSSGTINLGDGGITSSGGTYTITLSGGTFGTNNANWTTSLAATISSNAVTFAPDSGKTITWSGELSGAGGLTLDGEGELTLANPAYTGATTITQGTLNLSAAGTLHNLTGTTAGVLNNNGNTVTVESGADTEFAGVVVGSGGLTKTGTKTLTLSGANTYTGMTNVNAGVLELTGDAVVANGPVTVANDGTLEYNVANGQKKKLSIDATNKILSTGKVIKTGDGTLQLYSEAQGLIGINSLTVSSGRVDLKGYMTGGITVDANGVFSPGNSVGEATFGGDYILYDGATLLIEQDASGIDKLNVRSFTFQEDSVSQSIDLDITGIPFGAEYEIIKSTNPFTGNMLNEDYWLSHFSSELPEYMTLAIRNGNTVVLMIDRNQVPEPSTWALLLLGAAGLLYWRKRKNNK